MEKECTCGHNCDENLFKEFNGIELCPDCYNELTAAIANYEMEKNESQLRTYRLYSPVDIKNMLDEYVIGQEKAKKVLSVAVYNHYKRNFLPPVNPTVELQKSNVLLLGPSGCGKTLLAKTLAQILDVPFAIADATTLTEAGYVGADVENVLARLLNAADGDVERAEHGIIYIDEIDKIGRKGENPSITRDVSGEGVQQALLKIIEGNVVEFPATGGRRHPLQSCVSMDTSNILFICGGAFEGIDKLVAERNRTKQHIGFASQKDEPVLNHEVMTEDLVKFGLLPELLGRLPIITTLTELDESALVASLRNVKNSLVDQYTELFARDGVALEFTNDALVAIARQASERKIGARGLRSVIEALMLDIMFEIPSKNDVEKCIINQDTLLTGIPLLYNKAS